MDLSVIPAKSKSRQRERTENPIGLLASIIVQNPRGSTAEHIAAFKNMMRLESYADYAVAVCRIKYSTAHAAAVPPTPEEIEARRKEREARRKAEQAAIKQARVKLVGNVLARVMPNGKAFGKCTGPEPRSAQLSETDWSRTCCRIDR
jgi:hypothetical protein